MEMDSPTADEGAGGEPKEEENEDEKEFAECLERIRAEEGVKMFSDAFTKLYDSYFLLKEQIIAQKEDINELEMKISSLRETATGYDHQLDSAESTIETQRAEIDHAKAMCDAMHARELASVETVDTLKRQNIKLEKEIEARKRAGAEEDAGASSAAKEKEKFEKEKARLNLEIEGLKGRLQNAINYQEELERSNSTADMTILKLQESLEDAENNAVRTNRLVEHLKNESASVKKVVEIRGEQIGSLTERLNKADRTIERRDHQLKDSANKLDTATKEMEAAIARSTALRDSLDTTNAAFESTKQTLYNTTKDLQNRNTECTKLRNEVGKLTKLTVAQTKKYQLLEAAKASVESERDNLRQTSAVMEREIMLGKKQNESDRREIENLNREKDILNKIMQKIQADALENLQMLNLQEQRRKKLEYELEQNALRINKQRLVIRSLEKDKDRMLEEAIALNDKIDDITEEVRLRTADLSEAQKQLVEEGLVVRKLSASLDATRAERNTLLKNYTEALDEIQDLKQKLKMLAYQIEQLKEDISGKETGLKSCEAALVKCTKKTEHLRSEIQSWMNKLCDARGEIQALKQEEARMHRIIQEGDTARQKLSKELEGLMNERDVVGAQLVRRNDEITLLYEKIRILELTLHRGQRQYEQRLEDIRLLRLEVVRLRKEKNLLARGIENMTDLRLEVFNLERELGRERLRVRALEEALETPLNVHRWRKLAATEPDTVQLAHKLRLVQKKVLLQSETIVLKDRRLKETENLYNTVKDTLALQPSPDVQLQLSKTQRALSQRTAKLKCLVAELSMREKQVCEFRLEIAKITGELNSYKSKYFDLKHILDKEEQARASSPRSAPPAPDAAQQ